MTDQPTAPPAARSTSRPALRPLAAAVALLALAVAIAASAVLTVSHLPGMSAPGCGPGGGCDTLKASTFGVVPGTQPLFPDNAPPLLITDQAGWPTAYLGLAFFIAIAAAVLVSLRTGVHPALRWIARLGALASLVYIGVMLASRTLCPWCLAAHLGNFAFLAALELGTRRPSPARPPRPNRSSPNPIPALAAATAAFALASIAVGYAHNDAAKAELAEADAGIDQLIDTIARNDNPAQPTTVGPSTDPNGSPDPSQPDDTDPPSAEPPNADNTDPRTRPAAADLGITHPVSGPERPGATGFTGRYLLGPADARARIVTFANPVCPHCRDIEEELKALIDANPGEVSLSIKHFPTNARCNPIGRRNAQRGSCAAAYTLETAGHLGGPAAYWATSNFLYERFTRDGRISDEDMVEFVENTLNIPVETFRAAYLTDEIQQRVRDDVQQGIDLGVTATPAVFINGQPFLFWHVDNGITNAVERALQLPESRLPRATAAADAGPSRGAVLADNWVRRAGQGVKVFDERLPAFRENQQPFPENTLPVLRLTVFHDHAMPRSAEIDAFVRELIQQHPGVAYQPRVYPMNEDCNPFAGVNESARGCRAARAFVTAQQLAPPAAFLDIHTWLIDNLGDFTDDQLRQQFQTAGLDTDLAMQAFNSPDTQRLIRHDAAACHRASPNMRSPVVFLNGRAFVPLEFDGDIVVDDILEFAKQDLRQNPSKYQPRDPR